METNNYLNDITNYLQNALPPEIVDKIAIHPGKTGKPPLEEMKNDYNYNTLNEETFAGTVAHLYTLSNEINETEIIETEQNDITLQGIAYLLVLSNETNNNPKKRLHKLYMLLENLVGILANQRWELNYTFPVTDITAMDLYGLSYSSDKLVTSEGWDPTIQAYAKDLYQTHQEEPYPKNLSLWFVSWKQKLRINENIFK